MKRLLLHGPAIEASRRKLQELKEKFSAKGGPSSGWNPDNVVVFESSTSSGQVAASLMTVPMFSEERLIIWENPPEDSVLDLSLITSHLSLILWFDHKVDAKEWQGFEDLFFPESKEISVFPFLDLLAAKDKKAFLEIEKLKKGGFDIHYFITMVFYLLRNLVVTPKKAPDFVKRKLVKQKAGFGKETIINLYKDILEIDFKLKAGLLEKPQAEFLLVNKFIK